MADVSTIDLDGPAMAPPSGVTSNFDHPPNNNALGYSIVITAMTLCTLFVVLRIYSRVVYHKTIDAVDGIAIAALGAFAVFTYSILMILITTGMFVHQWDVRIKDLPNFLYYRDIGSIPYCIVIGLLKIGILLEWSRIFVPRGFRDAFWWTCWILIFLTAVTYTGASFMFIFACRAGKSDLTIFMRDNCTWIFKVNIYLSVFNLCSDLVILFIPQRILWKLKMTPQKKFGVVSMFGVGIFGCAAAIVRMRSAVNDLQEPDVMYLTSDLILWCIAEMVSGFFIVCMSALPKLLKESPVIQAFVSSIRLRFRSSSLAKPSSDSGEVAVATIGARRQHRAYDRSLFTDASAPGILPVSEVCVVTECKVEAEHRTIVDCGHSIA